MDSPTPAKRRSLRIPLPVEVLRDGDRPQAAETVVIGDIRLFRLGGQDLADLVTQVVADLGAPAGAVGLDLSGPNMNGALADTLRAALRTSVGAALAARPVVDCWRLLSALRTVLSDAEIAYVRQAAGHAGAGVEAFLASARPGVSEIELAAEIEYAMRAAGSDYPAIPTWMASGPRAWCQHAQASPRILRAGDLVHAEFSGVARRYQCMAMGSVMLGRPDGHTAAMAAAGREALASGLDAARVGARMGDLEDAYRDRLASHGMSGFAVMRFGVGFSAAYPPVWENPITIQSECDELLQPGMAFYLHASLQDLDDRRGLLLGASYLMTEDGPERLDTAPLDLVVVEG